jgi:hypothetical protein
VNHSSPLPPRPPSADLTPAADLATDTVADTVEQLRHPPTMSHGLPAWLLSLTLHATILVTLGLLVRVTQRGGELETARGGGIVLARDVEGEAEYYGQSAAATENTAAAEQSADSITSALPASDAIPVELRGNLPQLPSAPSNAGIGPTLPEATAMTSGGGLPQRGSIGGNQAKTSIFGAEGVGSKFVYVFDRSASMDGYQGRPLRAAKGELIASLNDLDKVHQFQIIFYNESPTVFNPDHPQAPRMLFGDDQTKRLAQNFVSGVIAAGGTQHMEALNLALGMNPDVIFFLTDAAEPQLSASDLQKIRYRNNRVGATIHAIEFGAGPSQGGTNFLQRLAGQNGGNHIYVDVTMLPGG